MNIKGNYKTGEVTVDDVRLDPSIIRGYYSEYRTQPDFYWGYDGAGPAALALAILMQVTKQDLAMQLHQNFFKDYIQDLPKADFELTVDVEAWLNEKMKIFSEFIF